MSRKPKNIYEELVLERVDAHKKALKATISSMERETEEEYVQEKKASTRFKRHRTLISPY